MDSQRQDLWSCFKVLKHLRLNGFGDFAAVMKPISLIGRLRVKEIVR